MKTRTHVYNVDVIRPEPVVRAEEPVFREASRDANSQGARRERFREPSHVQKFSHPHRASSWDDGTKRNHTGELRDTRQKRHKMPRPCRREAAQEGQADDGHCLLSQAGPCYRGEQTKDKMTSCVGPLICVDPKDDRPQEQSLCLLHITCAHFLQKP